MYDANTRLRNGLQKLEDADILLINKKRIKGYKDDCFSRGISKARVYKIITGLRYIAGVLKKDFAKVNIKDIKKVVSYYEQKEDFSQSTVDDYKIFIKQFYKWLKGKGEEYTKEVKWIKVNRHRRTRLPQDLLDEDDILKLIAGASHVRDKCLISVLFDSGMRIGELLSVQIKHVKFIDKYVELTCPQGKTGARRVLLIPSVPHLSTWINNHPLRDDPDAPLFVNLDKNRYLSNMTNAGVNIKLKRTAEAVGIKKKVNPHSFRHASATASANYLTEAQMKERFGWTQDSNMASVYIHLSGRDVDTAYKKMYGVKIEEAQEKSKLEPVSCITCKTSNEPDNDYCGNCGRPLSLTVANMERDKRQDADSFFNWLSEDPIWEEVMKKAQEYKKSKN